MVKQFLNHKIKIRMKKIMYNIAVMLIIGYCYGCKEEDRLDHIDHSASVPKPVEIKSVTNKAGGAIIKYQTPNDKNLLGVKAVYERNTGEICEAKASLYVDSLQVEGYGRTGTYTVQLYSVGVNGKLSSPIPVEINPLPPAVATATIKLAPSFGGVSISFLNQTRDNLALVLLMDTAGQDYWTPLQTFYTKADSGIFFRRGLEAQERKFGAYIRDRWNNKSDLIVSNLIPIEEVLIPKDRFSNQALPGDSYAAAEGNENGYGLQRLWDGTYNSRSGIFANAHSSPMPQHFTINLGYRISISRFKIYQRPGSDEYASSSPRTFELWGSDNPPVDGSWDNWHLLGEWEAFKPSGYAADGSVGTITAEDKTYATVDGVDCELTVSDKVSDPFRTVTHLRFKTLSTFNTHGTGATTGQVIICEMTLWGQIKDNY
jgi:hypothetical protein